LLIEIEKPAAMIRLIRRHFIEHLGRSRIALAQVVSEGHIDAGILLFRGDGDGHYFASSELREGFHPTIPAASRSAIRPQGTVGGK
jgi:hypothetical protein